MVCLSSVRYYIKPKLGRGGPSCCTSESEFRLHTCEQVREDTADFMNTTTGFKIIIYAFVRSVVLWTTRRLSSLPCAHRFQLYGHCNYFSQRPTCIIIMEKKNTRTQHMRIICLYIHRGAYNV